MNPRIRKEFRSLLAMVCVTPVVSVAPCWIWPEDGAGLAIGTYIFAICCAAMGASSFGNEFHWRTMPLLLAQPIPRQRIWREKQLALGMALFMALAFGTILLVPTNMIFGPYVRGWPVLWSLPLTSIFQLLRMIFFIVVTISVVTICTTPFLTMLARSTVGGLVFSFVIPFFILIALSILDTTNNPIEPFSPTGLSLSYGGYAILFYCLGYRKFLKLQVMDGSDQSIRVPRIVEAAFAVPFRAIFAGRSGPVANLVKKEFRLQQISFIMAALLFLAALAGIWAWRRNSDLSTLPLVLAYLVMAFTLPLLVGSLAVVEERAWGLAEWHVTLPVSARKQWLAKMAVTFSTSFVLSIVLPIVLSLVYRALTGSKEFEISSGWNILVAALFSLMLTGVAVYAASFCTNTIRAIFLAFGMAAAIALAVRIGENIGTGWGWFDRPTFGGVSSVLFGQIPELLHWAITLLGLCALFYLFQRLAFLNFKRREATVGRAGVQVLAVLFLIVMFVAVFSIPGYFR